MSVIPRMCPDCNGSVFVANIPVMECDNEIVYGWCVGCHRHFHGTQNDWLQTNWELPYQLVPEGARIATEGNSQEASSSDPERRETL